MKVESKRIFISDLPATATREEIQKIFNEYGKVVSIEVKERKELGPKNKSLFFAYINVDFDDITLQKCFKDFANETWHGEYVQLQLARESFLERLKREREETGQGGTPQKEERSVTNVKENDNLLNGDRKIEIKKTVFQNRTIKNEKLRRVKKQKEKSSSNSENDNSLHEPEKEQKPAKEPEEEKLDIIIKNNKFKTINKNGLKIESVGKEPIIKIDKSKKKDGLNTSEANLKRLQSLKDMKRGYQTQKSLIKAALSNVDTVKGNKIVFNDDAEPLSKKKKGNIENIKTDSNNLFNDESDADDFEGNFEVKEHFQGKKGQKLLQLQSRFKNDKRFELNENFLEDENDMQQEELQDGNEETSLLAEKQREYEILEQVIGKKITPKFLNKDLGKQENKKAMLRFDPSRPEHSEFQRPVEKTDKKERKKKKDAEVDILAEKKREETEQPEVSKDVFYKVTSDLKSKLHEKEEFSLLNMFGEVTESKAEFTIPSSNKMIDTSKNLDKNPFKYDSSDDEDNIPHSGEKEPTTVQDFGKRDTNIKCGTFWSEPFFFKEDDYRLQEGFDFLEKMKSQQKEFVQVRKELKGIVRAKVRNNERKNKMFKKKLGGSKNRKRKHIRIKKALNR